MQLVGGNLYSHTYWTAYLPALGVLVAEDRRQDATETIVNTNWGVIILATLDVLSTA